MHTTLIVVDPSEIVPPDFQVISFDQYLSDYPKLDEPRTRVINLCDTEHYLSRGYYCSLLAESRQHRGLPRVNTINDLRDEEGMEGTHLQALIPKVTIQLDGPVSFTIFFGWAVDDVWKKLGRMLFERYPSPLLRATLAMGTSGLELSVERGSLSSLNDSEREIFFGRLNIFTEQVWRRPSPRRQYRWDMAILYNPQEANCPSDSEAIKRFVRAASRVGIEADIVRSEELKHLAQYDALFIRETTRIDHPTYRLSRRGEKDGLVVIDDATSILRCCNKILLHDAFTYNGVSSPKTLLVSGEQDAEVARIEAAFEYPVVLKMPESSFSIGVYKVANREQLIEKLGVMRTESALALVQEYVYTNFDWRIGVLDGRAIYACQYFMVRDHWQIYNHAARQRSGQSGGFKTLPTFEVPKAVLNAAVKASSIIGRGLYGVDLKQVGDRVYVIEVNDNPSIEHGVEDGYLGDDLYRIVMVHNCIAV